RNGNRGGPVSDGVFETVGGEFALPRPGVVAAEAHEGPAVVASGLDDVDLVAAVRPVLVRPHGAGSRVDREPELVAVTQGKDLLLRPRRSSERIARRSGPVVVEPQDFAFVAGEVLR